MDIDRQALKRTIESAPQHGKAVAAVTLPFLKQVERELTELDRLRARRAHA